MSEYQVWVVRRGGFGWQLLSFEPDAAAAREAIRVFVRDVCELVDWRIVVGNTVDRRYGL